MVKVCDVIGEVGDVMAKVGGLIGEVGDAMSVSVSTQLIAS